MGRRGKRRVVDASASADELTGIARLLSEAPVAVLDLHGLTAEQARRRTTGFLQSHARRPGGVVVHVITGRGTRSEGAPVLPGVVRSLLEGEFSDLVSETAGLSGGGGVAIRLEEV